VVSFQTLRSKGLRLIREYPEHYSKLYEIPDAVPKAYIASEAIHDLDPKSTLQRLSSEDFDPRRQVILNAPVSLHSNGRARADIVISRYENSHVEIGAQLNEPGILVLTDSFDPGWKVLVNGEERQILRANHFFRAVRLPAGKHSVKFVYDPLSLRIGLMISTITAILLMAVPLAGSIIRRVAAYRLRRKPWSASLARSEKQPNQF
jgi:hypothetical protein